MELKLQVQTVKPTILLLSDDLTTNSGVATMSREIVVGTADTFNWYQLGGSPDHPEKGKVADLSAEVNAELGINDANVRVLHWKGFGDQDILRDLLLQLKPAAVMHFTDPRFWVWLYQMEQEIRQICPLVYYAIWDDTPFPFYNADYYASCDMILGISKQSHNIHKHVLIDSGIKVIERK